MNKTFSRLMLDWDRLLASVRSTEEEFPDLTAFRKALEEHFESVKALKARQLALLAECRGATRQLQQGILAGLDQARRLRSQVKADLGPRNPRLCQFGIAPIGKRRPR